MWLWSGWIDKMFGGEEFPERGPNFSNYSNSFKVRPKHFSKRGKNFSCTPIYEHAYLGANCAPVATPSAPKKAISVISLKSPLHKGKR